MREIQRSVCPHDCPSQCALVVTLDDGRVTDVGGDPAQPFTRGVVCGKVHDYAERIYAPTRMLTPLRRVGSKGEGRFEAIGWDAAIDEIAHRWRGVISEWGAEAILPFSYGGTLGLLQYWAGHPLFYALGASQLDRTICVTTAYADIVLPATTSMEHVDLYKSFGHLYVQLAEPVIEPVGESRSNWQVVRFLARAMGLSDRHFSKDEPALVREVLASCDRSVAGITYERLREERSVRLSVGRPYLPFADGAPTPSGKVEFVSESMAREGLPSLPTWVPLIEGPENKALAQRFPLQCIVPPNRFFLNSSFSQSDMLRRRQRGSSVFLHPEHARPRRIPDGDAVVVRSVRGEARFTATLTDDTRPGLAVIEGIWWSKHQAGGRGVNVITDDRLADMGRGPALHSNLVQVARL